MYVKSSFYLPRFCRSSARVHGGSGVSFSLRNVVCSTYNTEALATRVFGGCDGAGCQLSHRWSPCFVRYPFTLYHVETQLCLWYIWSLLVDGKRAAEVWGVWLRIFTFAHAHAISTRELNTVHDDWVIAHDYDTVGKRSRLQHIFSRPAPSTQTSGIRYRQQGKASKSLPNFMVADKSWRTRRYLSCRLDWHCSV